MSKKEEVTNRKIFRTILVVILIFVLILFLYARYVGTSGLVIKEYAVESPRLTKNFHGLKIVHFSDLHYGTTVFLPELENVVININKLKPDLIIFTGDLIDGSFMPDEGETKQMIKIINKLDPDVGIYAVRGNYDKNEIFNEIIAETNIILLENENELFFFKDQTPMLIVGIDYKKDYAQAFDETEEMNYYTIVIAHHPDRFNQMKAKNIDLYLAGHSHNGQVRLPFIGSTIKVAGASLYYDEEYNINETRMFISGGIGTSTLPVRLFNRPSINLYRFFAE